MNVKMRRCEDVRDVREMCRRKCQLFFDDAELLLDDSSLPPKTLQGTRSPGRWRWRTVRVRPAKGPNDEHRTALYPCRAALRGPSSCMCTCASIPSSEDRLQRNQLLFAARAGDIGHIPRGRLRESGTSHHKFDTLAVHYKLSWPPANSPCLAYLAQ